MVSGFDWTKVNSIMTFENKLSFILGAQIFGVMSLSNLEFNQFTGHTLTKQKYTVKQTSHTTKEIKD